MRHTPIANKFLSEIESTIMSLEFLKSSIAESQSDVSELIRSLEKNLTSLREADSEEVKKEFWAIAAELEQPQKLRAVYEVKFKSLLSIDSISSLEFSSNWPVYEKHLSNFVSKFNTFENKFQKDDIVKIITHYTFIMIILSTFQREIIAMLDEFTASLTDSDKESKIEGFIPGHNGNYRLASKRKTDFIKIMSAMYDTQMFTDKDGEPASNKQKLMEAFGEFLGDDFSSYSTSLSQAKIRDRKTFMKPFTEIEKAAERYLEEC